VSELWARGKKNILGYGISLMLKFSFILIIPPALLMMTFPEIIIRLFFGEAFLPVVLTLQILSIGSIFYAILSISSMTLMGMGKPFINTKVMFLIAIFNLISNILLIPSLGTVGAAATTTISYMIGSFMLLHFLKKNIRIKIPYKPLLKAFIGGFFTLLIILLLKEVLILNPWVEAFICLFLGTIFYMFFILSTKAITKDDLRVLSKINVPIPKLLIKISGRVVGG
ncbi:MAG: polysaccharide biosynthesis C-terminal domain-containing protein, partial [Candidatus Aenigmarchaeota archaeon]|nr:polysaccharide biosynthesis C-terminal domain-containing protein [Candidatus Aenigmarchaeota archaeon]